MAFVVTAAVDVEASPPLKSSSATKAPSVGPPELIARSVVVAGSCSNGIAAGRWNNLDGVDSGVQVRNRSGPEESLNLDDAVLVSRCVELFRDGRFRRARIGEDVEVGQDLVAIDGHVEIALPSCSVSHSTKCNRTL